MLTAKTLTQINLHVKKKFPEVASWKPKVRPQAVPKSSKDQANREPRFLVTYQGKIKLPNGESMERQVRVVVNKQGKIFKITTSR